MATESSTELLALATEALTVQKELTSFSERLENLKSKIRGLANGEKMTIEVPGDGKVTVSQPRTSSIKTVIEFNEKALEQSPELKKKLLEKNILIETVKTTPAAQASVSIKLNI